MADRRDGRRNFGRTVRHPYAITPALPPKEVPTRQVIRFTPLPAAGESVVMAFAHPAPTKAVRDPGGEDADDLEILTMHASPKDSPHSRGEMHEWVAKSAHDATADDDRVAEVGLRMDRTLKRRIRLARIETPLYFPSPTLGAAAQELGDRLRDNVSVESGWRHSTDTLKCSSTSMR